MANKINMSLDDIIKKERVTTQKNGGSKQRSVGFRGNFKGKRTVDTRQNGNRNKSNNTRQNVNRNNVKGNGVTRQNGNNRTDTAVAMRVVNKLVKQALQQRTNQSLIRRATASRRQVRGGTAVRPATIRRGGIRPRPVAMQSRLAGRLSGVSQRSRVIGNRSSRRFQNLSVLQSPQIVRGRGAARMGQLVSDEMPVVYERQAIARPIRQRQIVRTVVAQPQPRRQVVLQRRNRPIMVRQPQPTFVQRGGIRKRMVVRRQPNVVMVEEEEEEEDDEMSEQQYRSRPMYQDRVERVVTTQAAPRNRFMNGRTQYQSFNPHAEQFKAALGVGTRRRMQVEPQRFQSSNTFLQRVPVANRRGRGFRTVYYE